MLGKNSLANLFDDDTDSNKSKELSYKAPSQPSQQPTQQVAQQQAQSSSKLICKYFFI